MVKPITIAALAGVAWVALQASDRPIGSPADAAPSRRSSEADPTSSSDSSDSSSDQSSERQAIVERLTRERRRSAVRQRAIPDRPVPVIVRPGPQSAPDQVTTIDETPTYTIRELGHRAEAQYSDRQATGRIDVLNLSITFSDDPDETKRFLTDLGAFVQIRGTPRSGFGELAGGHLRDPLGRVWRIEPSVQATRLPARGRLLRDCDEGVTCRLTRGQLLLKGDLPLLRQGRFALIPGEWQAELALRARVPRERTDIVTGRFDVEGTLKADVGVTLVKLDGEFRYAFFDKRTGTFLDVTQDGQFVMLPGRLPPSRSTFAAPNVNAPLPPIRPLKAAIQTGEVSAQELARLLRPNAVITGALVRSIMDDVLTGQGIDRAFTEIKRSKRNLLNFLEQTTDGGARSFVLKFLRSGSPGV